MGHYHSIITVGSNAGRKGVSDKAWRKIQRYERAHAEREAFWGRHPKLLLFCRLSIMASVGMLFVVLYNAT